jgi:hypothetical protein
MIDVKGTKEDLVPQEPPLLTVQNPFMEDAGGSMRYHECWLLALGEFLKND